MELSFVAPDTQAHRYALKLADLPEGIGSGTTSVDPTWVNDALTATVRVFDAHHVHFADAYFTYHARGATQHPKRTIDKTTTVHVADDLRDGTPLLADMFAIAQLAVPVLLETSDVADMIDIHLVVERLRDGAPIPPADDIGDATFVSEIGADVQNTASWH